MPLHKMKFIERNRLKLVSKVFPIKETDTLLLDKLDIALKGAKINQINIPTISSPKITANFCIDKQKPIEIKIPFNYNQFITCQNNSCLHEFGIQIDEKSIGRQLRITCPVCENTFGYSPIEEDMIEDLTAWLKENLLYPQIESFSLLSKSPRKAGKIYRKISKEDIEDIIFSIEEGEKTCIHGLKKSWCYRCIQKEKHDREWEKYHADIFDIILPILQPPLGDEFDSSIAFKADQELLPFQPEGIKFLVQNNRALLGDDMGLGKTIQAIVAIRFLARMGKITNGLILCPRSVLPTWEKETWDWAPEIRLIKVRGSKDKRKILWNSPAHIYLTTYETLRQDLSDLLIVRGNGEDITRKQFDLIILDEIQKIKNPSARITKAVRLIDSQIRWGLSGTPLENRLEELVSIFAYLKPGLLQYSDAKEPWKVKNKIKPHFLRRRKTDALPDLPDKICEDIWLELGTNQREAYDKAEQEGIVTLNERGETITVQHILALITKLKQICNIDIYSKESCKLEYLLEKLEEISEQGDKALVFSQYTKKTIKYLKPKLKKFNPVIYSGELSDSKRKQIVRKFQEGEENKVLLMSVRAGGLGLTLTRASHVYHFDLWWNPSTARQAEDRTHRIGQEKTVFVTTLFTRDTIEERIQRILNKKRDLFKEVIDDLSDTNLAKSLTEDELFGLFPNIKKEERAIESLRHISPQQFEELIATLFKKMGYYVKLTSKTRDQGIDVFAKRISETGTDNYAIQCKHYHDGVVGVGHIRDLYGVIQANPSITKGILATSGKLSQGCKEFARGKRIELFDGKHINILLEKYDISFPKIKDK